MRVRITATIAVLVVAALSIAGVVVYAVELDRIDDRANAQAEQELDEFAKSQRDGVDRLTGAPFPSLEQMLLSFLRSNVTVDNELLLGWVDGRVQLTSSPQYGLHEDDAFAESIAPLVDEGGSARLMTSEGEALVTAQPVAQNGRTGALVVVHLLEPERVALRATMRTYALVAALSALVVVGVAFLQSGRLLKPLREVRRTADDINETDLSRRLTVRGNDDVTAMTVTINGMLDRLESAFTGQRQFLDDAGHELKTPLTILRGHLELLDAEDADEVTETRELLMAEVDRMARLVGDLILLAKADRPDFLTLTSVDLADVTSAVLAKARGLGDRDWQLDRSGTGAVVMDEQRITQALLQLADNAVKHTSVGETVSVGSARTSSAALLWVADSGPGIRTADRDRIFERFGRSRVAPKDEGFGLGLSIVGAIAEAHGGRVWLDTDHAPGARFVVEIPIVKEL